MNVDKIVATGSPPQLPHSFNEGCAFDVSDSSTQLDYADVRLFLCVVHRYSCDSFYPVLDCVCDVWDHLNSLSQVVSSSLSFDDMLVHLSGRDAVLKCQGDVEIAFVVPQIEVDFAAIVQHETLAVSKIC